ncbi:hypothetical protein GTQ40_02710 [Flavobacteriaceae bacterium R38]|nr:hypothetical protein [Flavobacteriaceae bacterium R38]
MKNTLLLVVVLVINFSFGQEEKKINNIEKNTWNLTGSTALNFNDSNNAFDNFFGENVENDIKNFSIDFSPQLGYAINNNFIVGLGIGYGYSKSETDTETEGGESSFFEATSQSFNAFPFIRAYKPIGNVFSFFLQGEARYSRIWNDTETSNSEPNSSKSNTFFIGVRPGFAIFVSKNFALETNIGALGYSTGDSEGSTDDVVTNKTDFNDFRFSLNSSDLRFGISYYF